MKYTLQPCVSCSRHIRSSEAACPFCHELQESKAPRLPSIAVGLALFLGACDTATPVDTTAPPAPSIEAPKQAKLPTPASVPVVVAPQPSSTATSAPLVIAPPSQPASAPIAVAPVVEPKPVKKTKKPKQPPRDVLIRPMYGMPAIPEGPVSWEE